MGLRAYHGNDGMHVVGKYRGVWNIFIDQFHIA